MVEILRYLLFSGFKSCYGKIHVVRVLSLNELIRLEFELVRVIRLLHTK